MTEPADNNSQDFDYPENKKQLMRYFRASELPKFSLRFDKDCGFIMTYRQEQHITGLFSVNDFTYGEWYMEVASGMKEIDESYDDEVDEITEQEEDEVPAKQERTQAYIEARVNAGSRMVQGRKCPNTMECLFFYLTEQNDFPPFKLVLEQAKSRHSKTYFVYYKDMKVDTGLFGYQNTPLWEWKKIVEEAIDAIDATKIEETAGAAGAVH